MPSRHWKIALTSSVCAATLLGHPVAFAQENILLPPVVIDGQVVEGQGVVIVDGTGPFDGVVAPATQTGSKIDTPLNEIPQAVSVIGREEIEQRGAVKIDEALRYTPSVFSQPFGPDNDTNWYYVRGFDATQSGDYLDGLRVPAFAFGDTFIDSFALERIEVLKGPASVLYGGSNPGGIINATTKRPIDERLRYAFGTINEFGTGSAGIDVGDRLSPYLTYRLTGRIEGGEGYTDFEEGVRGFIAPSVTIEPSDETKITIHGNYTHIDQRHGGGDFLPYVGTAVAAPFGFINRRANFTEPDIDQYDRRQGWIGYEAEVGLPGDFVFNSRARFTSGSVEERQVFAFGYVDPANPNLLNRFNFRHDSDFVSFQTDNRIDGTVVTGPVEHNLLFGIDTSYYELDQVQASSPATPISAINPVYGLPQPEPLVYLNQVVTQAEAGIYAQDQMRVGNFIATLNGRYDIVSRETRDGPTDFDPIQDVVLSDTFGRASGRAGLAYEFDNGITPYASVATFFDPIIGTNAAGTLFRPETGEQFEVGIKYEPTFFDGTFTVSLFDLTQRNVAVPDPNNPFLQVQLGEVNSQGIEVEGKFEVNDNISTVFAFTAFDLEIKKDTNPALIGKTPTIVPEIQASAYADYTFTEGWATGLTVGGGIRYQGESFADELNTLKVPDALLFDAGLSYERGNFGAQLNVTNIFDERYVSSCQSENNCSYGEARRIQLTAFAKW